MQIALDTIVYVLLTLSLFSMVTAMLPKIEQVAMLSAKEQTQPHATTVKEAVNGIIDVYLGKRESFVAVFDYEIKDYELDKMLSDAGLGPGKYEINFNRANSITVIKNKEGIVIING